MGAVTIGVDLGQMQSPTAIAVVETEVRRDEGRPEVYHIARRLERLPVGTSYPDAAARLREIVRGLDDRGVGYALYADATGIGQPVVDLVAREARVNITPVYFTHGDRRQEQDDGTLTVGKGWLVSLLQTLLQTHTLLLPRTPEAEILAEELLAYEVTPAPQANDTYGAFVVGTQDALLTALGLAVQPRKPVVGVWFPGEGVSGGWGRPLERRSRLF